MLPTNAVGQVMARAGGYMMARNALVHLYDSSSLERKTGTVVPVVALVKEIHEHVVAHMSHLSSEEHKRIYLDSFKSYLAGDIVTQEILRSPTANIHEALQIIQQDISTWRRQKAA